MLVTYRTSSRITPRQSASIAYGYRAFALVRCVTTDNRRPLARFVLVSKKQAGAL